MKKKIVVIRGLICIHFGIYVQNEAKLKCAKQFFEASGLSSASIARNS